MCEGTRVRARMFAGALVMLVGSACGPLHVQGDLGSAKSDAYRITYVREVIAQCSGPAVSREAADACAIAKLVDAKHMSRQEAASAVLDARVAAGGGR